ncbi:MAG: DNA double-strand break repair nuclease NurA, partial [Ktedonobacteraceae bacterium]
SLFEEFSSEIPDIEDGKSILSTYEDLLKLKPKTRPQSCPYATDLGCEEHLNVPLGLSSCTCTRRLAIYSTDALRIYERFHDVGANGEALGEVMQVWERTLLVHIIRSFERRGWLSSLRRLGFVLDGPLAFFGHPAWMSAAVSTELRRLNTEVRAVTGRDILMLGIEKSGIFVDHFAEIDQTETPGELLFKPRTCFMPSDEYIKNRIIYSKSDKRYGADTYFGRKLFYKTSSGARIVANIPFLSDEEDSLESDEISQYPQIPLACALLDRLVSSRFENAVTPIVAANAAAAIPLNLGAKVLQQLAHALMRDE